MPRLKCVIEKNGINKAAIITKKEAVSINQPNHKAPEKTHATDELVGYSL